MNIYKIFGFIVSILTNPILRLIVKGSNRSYLLLVADNKVLALKTILSINLKYEWLMPGGGVQKGEDSKTALVREVKEEIGLVLDPAKLTLINRKPLKSKLKFDYYVYTIKLPHPIDVKPNKFEIFDAKWIDLEEIHNYPCSDELKTALKAM